MVKVNIKKIGNEWMGVIGDGVHNYFDIIKDGAHKELINDQTCLQQSYTSNFDMQEISELRTRVSNLVHSLNLTNAEKINYSLDYVLDPEAREDILL